MNQSVLTLFVSNFKAALFFALLRRGPVSNKKKMKERDREREQIRIKKKIRDDKHKQMEYSSGNNKNKKIKQNRIEITQSNEGE